MALKDGGNGVMSVMFIRAVAVTTLVFAVSAFASLFSAFGGLLAPLPVLYYYSRMGRLSGMLVLALSLAGVTFFFRLTGVSVPFFYFFLYGLLGPILSEVLRKHYSIERTIVWSMGIFLIGALGVVLIYSLAHGTGPWELIRSAVSRTVQEKISVYDKLEIAPEQIRLLKEHAQEIIGTLLSILPAFMLIGVAFFVWANVIVGKWLFEKMGMWYPDFGDLSRWRMPDKLVWVLIAAGGTLLMPVAVMRIVGLNLFFLLIFFYMFQGLSIVEYFFRSKNIPRVMQLIGYVFIFAQQIMFIVVAALGLIDVWVDFRKVNKSV